MKNLPKVLLIILDGWGLGKKNAYNAIYLAKTSFFDQCWQNQKGLSTKLKASGKAVGLTAGQMGSSEVGHIHIGAGRIVKQELTRINDSLEDQSFNQQKSLVNLFKQAKKRKSALHLIGLLSDGGVHSHQKHLFRLLDLAFKNQISPVFVHAILDGRDVPPASSIKYLKFLNAKLDSLPNSWLASLCGRYFAMDRDQNWQRTKKFTNLLLDQIGTQVQDPFLAVKQSYDLDIFDEFLEPVLLEPNVAIKDKDAVLFFNFRADRMRQLCQVLLKKRPNLIFASMIDYGVSRKIKPIFRRSVIKDHLCEVLSKQQIKFLKITETQKYPHLTYFFNGKKEEPYVGEKRILIPSKKTTSYAQCPKMSALEITKTALKYLTDYPVIIINFANPDMVGHTGDIKAGIQAAQCVDKCLSSLVPFAIFKKYQVIITADHGNLEEMYSLDNNSKHTAHTNNLVPFMVLGSCKFKRIKKQGSLANIAPTVLDLLKIKKPKLMTAESLVKN